MRTAAYTLDELKAERAQLEAEVAEFVSAKFAEFFENTGVRISGGKVEVLQGRDVRVRAFITL